MKGATAGPEDASPTLGARILIRHSQPVLDITVLIDDAVTRRWINEHRDEIPVKVTGLFKPVP